MNITDFEEPKAHPFDLLHGYNNAYEKEGMLAFLLSKCIQAGKFKAVETIHSHPTMVDDGLLEQVGERKYKLTKKAIGLLYSRYAKAEAE